MPSNHQPRILVTVRRLPEDADTATTEKYTLSPRLPLTR